MPSVVPTEDRDQLARFLLGQISASEAEEVEERILVDRDFFSSYEEVEEEFIRDYVRGHLDVATVALFERNYLITDERKQQIELFRVLLEGKRDRRSVAVTALTWFKRPMFGWAMAGVAAVTGILVWLKWPTQSLPVSPSKETAIARSASPTIRPQPDVPSQQRSVAVEETKQQKVSANVPASDRNRQAARENGYGNAPKPLTPSPRPETSSPVDNLVALLRAKMSEPLIIRTIRQPIALTSADLVKLKQAGATDNLISSIMNPASAASLAASSAATSVTRSPTVLPSEPVPTSLAPTTSTAHLANPAPVPDAQAQKKRVAVEPFDYSAVMTTVQAVLKTNVDIGKGIQALMVTRLAKDNKVVVVDRSKLKNVLAEQDMTAGNRVKQGSGARIGRVSGADAILAGDIIIFGRDDKKKSGGIGAGTFGRFCYLCGGAAAVLTASKTEDKAVVAINYRLIDAETTEVIATGEARGESIRKSKDFMGAFAKAYGGAGAASFDMTSSNFAETIIGEATQDCVNKLAAELDKQTVNMKKRVREVEATVVDVKGNSLMISAGSGEGVNVGEVFDILEALREVKDPTTGEILDRVTEKRGELVINTVRDKVSIGNYSGSVPAQVKFLARKKVPPQQ